MLICNVYSTFCGRTVANSSNWTVFVFACARPFVGMCKWDPFSECYLHYWCGNPNWNPFSNQNKLHTYFLQWHMDLNFVLVISKILEQRKNSIEIAIILHVTCQIIFYGTKMSFLLLWWTASFASLIPNACLSWPIES